MEYFVVIFICIVLFVLITRPFTVLLHELGHAIPAIIMTKQPVSIYVGSYGDPKNSLHFRVGLLGIWLKYNPFLWRLGQCVPSAKQISTNKKIIYTLTGPLTSFVFALVACYFTFAYGFHGYVKLILVIFLGSAILDLFVNLIPRAEPVRLYNGSLSYNDGYQLKKLFYYKIFSKEYEQAVELYTQQKFGEAALAFKNLLKIGLKYEDVYRLAINSFFQVKNYTQVKVISERFIIQGNMNSDDFGILAISYSQIGEHDNALELYDKSLELNPNNIYSLSNKGFTMNLLNKFEEAIPLFDKAIELDKAFAYSYNNRGLSKIKIGKTEEGLEDINYSFKLDEYDSYGYRNLGIHHLDKGDYSKALDLFRKAKELDGNTHMIDDLISNAELHGEN
jgi:tetratricopeptide (TPR) repeat protein